MPSIEIVVPPLIVTDWAPSSVMSCCGFWSIFPVVSRLKSLSDLIVITSFACMLRSSGRTGARTSRPGRPGRRRAVAPPFQTEPSTYGRCTSSCSKPITTSSPTCGIIKRPRALPASGAVDARPPALGLLAEGRVFHPDAAHVVGVVVVRDEPDRRRSCPSRACSSGSSGRRGSAPSDRRSRRGSRSRESPWNRCVQDETT